MTEKALEQLHYFNLQCDIDSIYGDWVVTRNGDIVNFVYPFAIFHTNFDECDWAIEIRKKVWFTNSTGKDMNSAFSRATEIINATNHE